MGRKPKRCPKQCKKHGFLLKPVHYSAVFSRELSASFCPSALRGLSITPKFNKDKRHFTISFIIPSDYVRIGLPQKKITGNQEYYKTEHQRCRMENGIEKSNMYIAKPRAKSSYCSVCKDDYDDYLEHIQEQTHKKAIKENRFNNLIDELQEKMKKKAKEEEMRFEESKFHQYSDTNMPSYTQQNTHFEEKSPFEPPNDYLFGFQYKQINDLLHFPKNFHPLNDHIQKIVAPQMIDQHSEPIDLPLSPTKKMSEGGEGGRALASIKPIIISGLIGQNMIH